LGDLVSERGNHQVDPAAEPGSTDSVSCERIVGSVVSPRVA
jgi:hypothetical protein